jgi:hypothetical protein
LPPRFLNVLAEKSGRAGARTFHRKQFTIERHLARLAEALHGVE